MDMKKTFMAAAATGLLALGGASIADNAQAADEGKEKCYGVAKAGANDCGSKANGHSCAGQSKVDGDKNEFIAVPKGLCERLAGGLKTEGGK